MSSKSLEQKRKDCILGAITCVICIPLLVAFLPYVIQHAAPSKFLYTFGNIAPIALLAGAGICLVFAIKLTFDIRKEKVKTIQNQAALGTSSPAQVELSKQSLLHQQKQKVDTYLTGLIICGVIVLASAVYEFIDCGIHGCGNMGGVGTFIRMIFVAPFAIVFLILFTIAKANYKSLQKELTKTQETPPQN